MFRLLSPAQRGPAQAPSGPLPHNAAWEIMTGAPVPRGADAVLMLEHVEVINRPGAPAVFAHRRSRRKHRGPWCAGPQRGCAAPCWHADRRCTDCACRGLRLRKGRSLRESRASRFWPLATNLCRSKSRRARARFATPTRRCWRRWLPPAAASRGSCPSQPTQKKPSTLHSSRRRTRIFCSLPAASPRANSISSNRHWRAIGAGFHFTGCAHPARQANGLWQNPSPTLRQEPYPKPEQCQAQPGAHEVLLFRLTGESSLLRRHVFVARGTAAARAGRLMRHTASLCSRAPRRGCQSEAWSHALSSSDLHIQRRNTLSRARFVAGQQRHRCHGARQLLSCCAGRCGTSESRHNRPHSSHIKEIHGEGLKTRAPQALALR